jgi:hypothetical protein
MNLVTAMNSFMLEFEVAVVARLPRPAAAAYDAERAAALRAPDSAAPEDGGLGTPLAAIVKTFAKTTAAKLCLALDGSTRDGDIDAIIELNVERAAAALAKADAIASGVVIAFPGAGERVGG